MRGVFFYTVGIAITSGILFRSFFNMGGMSLVLTVLLMSFACGLVWRMQSRHYTSGLFIASLFLLCFALGFFRFHVADVAVSPLSAFIGDGGVRTGVVAREPEARATSLHLYVRDSETDALFLVLTDPFLPVSYGDRIEVSGVLTLPETFETDTGRTFDYRGYLRARGVQEVMSRADVIVVAHDEGSLILSKLFEAKHAFMRALERSITEPAAGLGEGLLLGVKRALGEGLEETFRTVGIIHIVVLSGYNIMIVADSVMRVLSLLFFPRTRMFIGVGTIALFALLVGLSATVVRASIMAALVLIARATGRQYAVLRALMLAGTVMLFINPYLLVYDPGFQLSFLATLGLILLSPEIEIRISKIPAALGLRGYLATTLGTQLFVLPLLLYSMGTLSFVSVLANVLVLPMVPIAMFLTFMTGIVGSVFTGLGIVTGFVTQFALTYIIKIAELLSTIPFAAITVPAFPWWGVVCMYAGIAFFTLWLTERGIVIHTINRMNKNYEDWIIEEEIEIPLGTQSTLVNESKLPFR